MKPYEIINPSDLCYFSAESDAVAAAAGLLLGEGFYGLEDNGRKVLPLFMFGGEPLTWFRETFGEDLEPFLHSHAAEIAACLDSIYYPGERSSLNDIGKKAKRIAASFRARTCAVHGGGGEVEP